MNIFDFISQDQLDELPDDNNMAFTEFTRIAQRRLAEATQEYEERERWEELREARHGFMNIVIAAAKRYAISPFSTLDVPRLSSFDSDTHRQFKADLDHYMTQLVLDNSVRGKRDSVLLAPKAQERIRSHVSALKDCIDKSSISDAKRAALLKRLAEFEAELDKRRLNLLAVTWVTLEVMAMPGALWQSADIAHKLVANVLQTVGEAKAVEDETRRLGPTSPPAAITGPRKEYATGKPDDLDDEIPF